MNGAFAARLLRWFDANRRDLPWRRTRDPWAIWVSEVMLQQTRVEAVRAAYERFLAVYPTPAGFAAADDDALHAAWRGLGYYRRARLLRDGARTVVRDHGGAVPHDVAALGDLPGVGAYTRGALASIAFGAREVAVDGNVERVTARHRAIREPVASAAVRAAVAAHVRDWQDPARPGDFNQALMELGAVVCTPRAPACARCPVAADCEGRRLGIAAELPARLPPRRPTTVAARAALARVRGGVLAFRIPEGEVNAGQVELPGPGLLRDCTVKGLAPALRERFGCRVEVGNEIAAVRHTITSHRITLRVHAAAVRARGGLRPHDPDDPSIPWTTASRKAFRALARGHAAPHA